MNIRNIALLAIIFSSVCTNFTIKASERKMPISAIIVIAGSVAVGGIIGCTLATPSEKYINEQKQLINKAKEQSIKDRKELKLEDAQNTSSNEKQHTPSYAKL